MTKDTGHDCIDGIRKGYSAEYCEFCLRQENEKLKAELAAAKQEIERLRKRIDGEWHAQDLLATDASNLNRERDTLNARCERLEQALEPLLAFLESKIAVGSNLVLLELMAIAREALVAELASAKAAAEIAETALTEEQELARINAILKPELSHTLAEYRAKLALLSDEDFMRLHFGRVE
jgi:predicted NBD/HSP70 family sugar kinase